MKKQAMRELGIRSAPPDFDPLAAQRHLQTRILDRFPHAPVLDGEAPSVEDAAMVAYLNAQAVNIELGELLDHLPLWKWWKEGEDSEATLAEYDEAHDGAVTEAKFELVDVLHFFLNIAIALGMDWQEVMDIFFTKQAENHDRQERGY